MSYLLTTMKIKIQVHDMSETKEGTSRTTTQKNSSIRETDDDRQNHTLNI